MAQLQYSKDADTLVQTMRLETRSASSPAISLYEDATDEWLETWIRLSGRSQHSEIFRSLLNAIPTPSAYVVARTDGQSVGCARAVVSGSIMGLFDLMVDPEHRGQGLGRGLLEARLNWGFEQGARLAYLQVMANNEPALALQRKYGFSESYRYWYRVQPSSDLEDGNC
ncbi:MAG: GNAT family N-acetyltransferase [Gemmatimonadota bacterium]|nr:GNAT family N-acetyltransferase [Gemmatimonadota bacterium]